MNHWILRLLPVLILAGAPAANGDSIVIPSSCESTEGNTYSPFPFSPGSFGIQTQRHQQVYAASAFGANSGPLLITEIRFRPDSGAGRAFTATLPDVRIDLSTTTVGAGQLSREFDSNLGAECATVFEGPLTISSSKTGPAFGPKDFDIVIPLTAPFLYDPAQGNLLMDIRNSGGGPLTTYFDAVNDWYQETERCYSTRTGVNSPVADFVDPIVLVTQFMTAATVIDVLVDVKPGSNTNPLNLKSSSRSKGKSTAAGGVLPVAILTTETFDAACVDSESVELGDPLLDGAASPIKASLEDVDGDGDLDLLLHFSVLELVNEGAVSSSPPSETLFLSGHDLAGHKIAGFDTVTIVP